MGLCLKDDLLLGSFCSAEGVRNNTVETFSFERPFDAEQKKAIRAYMLKNKLEGSPAVVLVDSTKCQYFLIDDISVDKKYKKEAIQWGLTDFLDYPAEDAVVEYIELPSKSTTNSKKMIYAFAVHKDIIEKYQSWAADCKVKVVKIDIWQNTVKQLLSDQDAMTGVMILLLRPELIEIVILRNKEIYLLRQLDISIAKHKYLQEKSDEEAFYSDLCVEIHRTIDFCASKILQPNVSQVFLYDDMHLPIDFQKIETALGIKIKSIMADERIQKKNIDAKFIFAYGAITGVVL